VKLYHEYSTFWKIAKNVYRRASLICGLWDKLTIMTRGILIAGNESSLFAAVASEAVKRVKSFASVLIPNRYPLSDGSGIPPFRTEAGAIPLSWNPGSPISARTLVLAAENRLEKIDEAILICLPPAVFKTTETLAPEEIEILVNDHIKGWFFLIRELTMYFRRMGTGSLSFVAPETDTVIYKDTKGKNSWNKTQIDLLGGPALASFRAFVHGILAASAHEPFQMMGFTGCEAGVEGEFASWLFKIADERSEKNSGRWQKYPKRGFFR
jgi:hypothetical protein